jgi:predicted P-loop ATPase
MNSPPQDFNSWAQSDRDDWHANQVDSGGDVAQKFAAEIVNLATRKPKRERPKRDLPDWADRCIKDDMGRIVPNLANVLVALRALPELADAFAYDEMSCASIIRKALPVAPNGESASGGPFPRAVRDEDVSQLQEWLQHQGMPKIGKDQVHQAVDQRAMERAFHPVRDYLDGLRWDKTHRVDEWLSTYLGAPKDAYTARIGRMFIIAMVARIFKPGCKVDYMLVLEGEQGERKSSALRILAGEKCFSDSLPDLHHGDAVRLSMHLRGKWLVEVGELSAIGKADTEALKAFITRQEERFTPKFGRKEVTEPRQCVFAGSTNKDTYLKDETGARRFWPFKVGRIDLDALAKDRDQLFAEAVAAYRAGEPWWPDAAFERAHIKPQQDARFEVDAWEEAIGAFVKGQDRVTIAQVAGSALGIEVGKVDKRAEMRIAAVLTGLHWIIGPGRPRNWIPTISAQKQEKP